MSRSQLSNCLHDDKLLVNICKADFRQSICLCQVFHCSKFRSIRDVAGCSHVAEAGLTALLRLERFGASAAYAARPRAAFVFLHHSGGEFFWLNPEAFWPFGIAWPKIIPSTDMNDRSLILTVNPLVPEYANCYALSPLSCEAE